MKVYSYWTAFPFLEKAVNFRESNQTSLRFSFAYKVMGENDDAVPFEKHGLLASVPAIHNNQIGCFRPVDVPTRTQNGSRTVSE